jgi:hypothetical protein
MITHDARTLGRSRRYADVIARKQLREAQHARLAAEVRAADDRIRAWSRRAADVALGAVLVGLGWLVMPYIGG